MDFLSPAARPGPDWASGFLLDTNVVSELMTPRPSRGVVAWVDTTPEDLLYLTFVTRNTKDVASTGVPVFNP